MNAQALIAELNLSATALMDTKLEHPEGIAIDNIRECSEMWMEENGADMKEAITANPESETSIGQRIRNEMRAYGLTYAEWQYAVACALSLHVIEAKSLILTARDKGKALIDFDVFVMTAAALQEEVKSWGDGDGAKDSDYSGSPYWIVSSEDEIAPVKDFNDLDGFTLV